VADWGGGMSACMMQDRGSNCSLARAMDGRIIRCGVISSCKLAASSQTANCVSSAMASTGPSHVLFSFRGNLNSYLFVLIIYLRT